jgi:two-component system sensor histidine kinase PhoQ
LSTAPEPQSFSGSLRALKSLHGRFIAASLLCLPLFIGASGYLLEAAFKDNLLAAEQQQLQSQFYILLGAAELQEQEPQQPLWMPEQLPEPRYSLADSGLYASILLFRSSDQESTGSGSRLIWQSPSAALLSTPLPTQSSPFNVLSAEAFEEGFRQRGDFFELSFDLTWETADDEHLPLRFLIHHRRDAFLAQLKSYRQQLWYGLSILAMGLLVVQVLIMRWGLQPLKRLVRDLRKLPQQPVRQLQGQYPLEIEPVTDSLNQVLHNEQQQRERYRNTLSDLAHSLKTPLAIVRGEMTQPSNDGVIDEQLQRMESIIRHQLQRAVLQSDPQMHKALPLRPVVERLCNAMDKVYRDKGLQFDIQIPQHLSFPIASQDLFELLGNLIENACKYGRKQIGVSAALEDRQLCLQVSDDGEGVAPPQRQTILQRGARADTARPGQGIGLAVSTDIVSAYGGSLSVDASEQLGGAEFSVRLPLNH